MPISQPTKGTQYLTTPAYERDKYVDTSLPIYQVSTTLTFTAAGFTSAAAGDLSLLRLPPGRIRIRLDLSKIVSPQGTSTADLDIGLAAFTKSDGTTQALQGNVLADSLDVGGAALNQALGVGSVIAESRWRGRGGLVRHRELSRVRHADPHDPLPARLILQPPGRHPTPARTTTTTSQEGVDPCPCPST
jgi:hypothetical protein